MWQLFAGARLALVVVAALAVVFIQPTGSSNVLPVAPAHVLAVLVAAAAQACLCDSLASRQNGGDQ